MRPACAISITWAILLAFLEAPFAHTHEQAFGEDHHATEQAHPHVPRVAARTNGLAFDRIDPADDERLVNWFQTVEHSGFFLYVAPRQNGIVAPDLAREVIRAAPLICGHDPPPILILPSRAPPVVPA